MDMTPEEIRDCAVKAVEAFINEKIPLSKGVAEVAEMQALNPEQIKRVIEAANSIAYLKLLNGATDRTFEFPVAEYTEVMGHLAIPKGKLIIDTSDPKEPRVPMEEAINKDDIGMFPKMAEYTKEEQELFLMRAYTRNRQDLEKLAHRKEEIKLEMEDALNKLIKSGNGLEKLAEVAEEILFQTLSPFFGLEKTAEEGIVFREKDLSEAKRLVNLCKEAMNVVTEEKTKEGFDKRAENVLGKVVGGFMSKTPTASAAAGIGAGAAAKFAGGAGAALGATLVAGPALAAKGVMSAAKHAGGWGVFNTVTSIGGASSYKPKNEDVWKALHG